MNANEQAVEGLIDDDRKYAGSRFAEVRDAIFANPYQRVWGAAGEGPFERFPVNFLTVMRGFLSFRRPWVLLAAARRTLASKADLRWGPDRKGFRRLVHANAICMTGMWEITEETPYSGYFAKGSRGLTVARYSTCCTETRRGHTRSLSMVGRIFPTTDPEHTERLPTANFITQEDIGGDYSKSINEALLRNAPNTTVFRRGLGFPTLLATGAAGVRHDSVRDPFDVVASELLARLLGEPAELLELQRARDRVERRHGAGRTADVNHTRPFPSNIGLCTLLRLVQIASSPQYGEGCGMVADVRGVFGSRTVSGTRLTVCRTGSSTGR